MKKIKIIPFVASLTMLFFFYGTSHTATPTSVVDDGPVAAITTRSADLPLDKIKLPPGFSITVYAEVEGARWMGWCLRMARYWCQTIRQGRSIELRTRDRIGVLYGKDIITHFLKT